MSEGFHAWFLVGPTACGKTAVAHWLARRHGFEILSADAMLVYRGMDIGTAKPSCAERQGIRYHGIDRVDPDASFSVGAYLEHARAVFETCADRGVRLLVTGGTGLDVQALRQGLDAAHPADASLRREWSGRLQAEGIERLHAEIERRSPGLLVRMPDSRNPRRLIRVIERLAQGEDPLPRTFEAPGTHSGPPMAALTLEPPVLSDRIRQRASLMFEAGLIKEARALRERFPDWSPTASSAIGYAEALAILADCMTEAEALERVVVRTRQLAKRQRTWYRHRTSVAWIGGPTRPEEIERAAGHVEEHWRTYGSHPVFGLADCP